MYTPWNPNPKALARVTDKFPIPTSCPHCGSAVEIRSNKVIYNGTEYGDKEMFAELWNNLDWLDVAGPRLEYYINKVGVPYTYGVGNFARTYQPQPMHPAIEEIWTELEMFTKTKFEVCFLNGYRDGKDQLGWHADDSPEMDDARPIAIISLGAEREIWFRKNPSKCYACNGSGYYDAAGSPPCGTCNGTGREPNETHVQKLGSGSLCLMLPGMQDTHQHRIPKSSLHKCDPRISLTFRGFAKT